MAVATAAHCLHPRHSGWPTVVVVVAAAPSNSPTHRSSCRHRRTVAIATAVPCRRIRPHARPLGRSLWRTAAKAVAAASRQAASTLLAAPAAWRCQLLSSSPHPSSSAVPQLGVQALARNILSDGEVVAVADDEAGLVGFVVGPWGREATFCRHVLRVNKRATRRITKAPGITSINANSKNDVMALALTPKQAKESPAHRGERREAGRQYASR